jgi:replication factor C subunit 1
VPAKPVASKKELPKPATPKKTKRGLSDEDVVEKVVTTVRNAKKAKESTPKKEVRKKETPKKNEASPKKTPKKAEGERKKQPKPLTFDSDSDEPLQPVKKVAKMDDDDGVVLIVSDEEVKPKPAKTATPQKKKTVEAKLVEAKKKESPLKKQETKSPEKKKAKTSENATAVAAAPTAASVTKAAAPEKKKFNWRATNDKPAPPMLGLKPLPVGEENCLFGKVFVITGTLESLSREDAERLIVQ